MDIFTLIKPIGATVGQVATGFNADMAFKICLIIGILLFAATVICFFVFNIPQIFMIKTGRGEQKAIKKMNDVNAATGRLRGSHSFDEFMNSQPDAPITSEKKRSRGKSAEFVQTPIEEPSPSTEILQTEGTTVLHELSGETRSETVPIGLFEIVFDRMDVHTNERV